MSDHWHPERYRTHASFVAELGAEVLDMLAPGPGERILDVGCGDGRLTRALAERSGEVVAIDASAAQVRAARAAGQAAEVLDAAELIAQRRWSGYFDAVFSNAALHWMPDHDVVFDGCCAVLRHGGRLVVECGGAGNVAQVRAALHQALRRRGRDPDAADPWCFAAPAETAVRLARSGFEVDSMELFPRPTPLPGALADWLTTFAGPFLEGLPAEDAAAVIAEVEQVAAPRLQQADGSWLLDYVRLRFTAHRL